MVVVRVVGLLVFISARFSLYVRRPACLRDAAQFSVGFLGVRRRPGFVLWTRLATLPRVLASRRYGVGCALFIALGLIVRERLESLVRSQRLGRVLGYVTLVDRHMESQELLPGIFGKTPRT